MMLPLVALSLVAAPNAYAAEGARLLNATIAAFYDPKTKIWKPPVASAESVGDQGYTFWPSLLAWQAVIEAAKVDPKTWKPRVGPFFDVLEQYYDRQGHAYCAWRFFPGNDDHFYDDNTWAAVACMEAFQVTREPRYRTRAIEIFDKFVRGGWDVKQGGLRWGTKAGIEDRNDHTVSATAAGALAALLIGRPADRPWAKKALDWIRDLAQPNGLIRDGRKNDGTIMPTVWTYNTGVPIRAAVEYAKRAKDESYLQWATTMGNACLDRTQSPMFDGAVKDPKHRYWYDAVYFVQYLTDGMRILSKATGDPRYLNEAKREADYIETYLKDRDGLYWRNMRLWTINEDRRQAFLKLTGQTGPELVAEESERLPGPAPVNERPLAKSLLANAATARMFWLLAH